MTVSLAKATSFCFDFDGVFYSPRKVENVLDVLHQTKAELMCELLGESINYATAIEIAKDGYHTHGNPVTAYSEWATTQGIDPDSFRLPFFHQYHQRLKDYLQSKLPSVFCNRTDLKEAFSLSHGKVTNGVATHSCANNLVKPVLESMGISQYFTLHAVHGLDEAGFTLKNKSPKLVNMAFESMSADEDGRAYVEDSAQNLKLYKEHNPDTLCILINNGDWQKHLPGYIDAQFPDILQLKRAYSTSMTHPDRFISIP